MGEHGFTPGPWKLGRHHRYVYGDDDGAVVFANDLAINRDEAEMLANARLIAASPTLLEALEQVARPYGMLDIAVNNARGEMVDEMLTVAKQIRAAITLATGKDA